MNEFLIYHVAFSEWTFGCIFDGVLYILACGISFIKFSDDKIVFMNEYRITRFLYDWEQNLGLASD